jgi:hypothetical protein
MTSTFAWLDFSEKDRRRALDAISLLNGPDTRDELGVGTIRDALADTLFPGTTTIQTRARYFLLIPWLYQILEKRRTPPTEFGARLRQAEGDLIETIDGSDDANHLIGGEAGRALKRMPSNIYWQGLGRLGIRRFIGSQTHYHRTLEAVYRRSGAREEAMAIDSADGRDVFRWHPGLPSPPSGFPRNVSLHLRHDEALFLHDQIMALAGDTCLAFLVRQENKPNLMVDFPWQVEREGMSAALVKELTHARLFALAMHGAALLYNLLLSEAAQNTERIDEYRARLAEWETEVAAVEEDLASWDRGDFWELVRRRNPRVGSRAVRFVQEWWQTALDTRGHVSTADVEHARNLVALRERELKRDRARLVNLRALENWSGAAGTARLNYRWPVVRLIADDIRRGLEEDD